MLRKDTYRTDPITRLFAFIEGIDSHCAVQHAVEIDSE